MKRNNNTGTQEAQTALDFTKNTPRAVLHYSTTEVYTPVLRDSRQNLNIFLLPNPPFPSRDQRPNFRKKNFTPSSRKNNLHISQ